MTLWWNNPITYYYKTTRAWISFDVGSYVNNLQPEMLGLLKQGTKTNDEINVDWDAELATLLAEEGALVWESLGLG